ncbi:zonular occludens toxin domain-containing protein [Marinimicrobium agarilyticum]|uniref:zonular occludens toxin domain-containing protein n=1 Tax=Marinimicrobium agarilyticum TaxID=306546 RepID=UPI0003F6EB25|nr:zonular occludens toxin domain-containing protein [Marinimicrobium agarilyticum]
MSVYIVTGKLGNGKTLVTVGRIRDALHQGRRIATNLDLNLHHLVGRTAKNVDVLRIPDKPTVEDLNALGKGYDGPYNEDKFGVLVLDECGTWFNSRNWQDKTRGAVNDWFLHARKLGWDVYIIIQDLSLLDSQAREAIAELIVYCRRLDKLRLPFFGRLLKLFTGYNLTMPRLHRAKVTYADDDLISDVWWYRGNDLFQAYDTQQVFLKDYPHKTYCLLTPWHTHGRHAVPLTPRNLMRLTKIYWKRFKSPVALATGLLLGVVAGWLRYAPETVTADQPPTQAPQAEQSAESVTESSLSQKLEALFIKGSMTINGETSYQFTTPSETDRYWTDQELANVGVTLRKLGPCRVEAFYDGSRVPILCF